MNSADDMVVTGAEQTAIAFGNFVHSSQLPSLRRDEGFPTLLLNSQNKRLNWQGKSVCIGIRSLLVPSQPYRIDVHHHILPSAYVEALSSIGQDLSGGVE